MVGRPRLVDQYRPESFEEYLNLHYFEELYPQIDFPRGAYGNGDSSETLEELIPFVGELNRTACEKLADFVGIQWLGDEVSKGAFESLKKVPAFSNFYGFSSPDHIIALNHLCLSLDIADLWKAYRIRFPERYSPNPNFWRNPLEVSRYEFACGGIARNCTVEAWEKHIHEQPEPEFERFYSDLASWLFLIDSAAENGWGVCFEVW